MFHFRNIDGTIELVAIAIHQIAALTKGFPIFGDGIHQKRWQKGFGFLPFEQEQILNRDAQALGYRPQRLSGALQNVGFPRRYVGQGRLRNSTIEGQGVHGGFLFSEQI